jgi:branched-chain amino acid transport system permease protein
MLIFVALYRPNGLIPAKRKKNDLEAIKNSSFGKGKLGILSRLAQSSSGKQT